MTVLHKGIHDDNMQRVAQIKMYISNLLVAKWERRELYRWKKEIIQTFISKYEVYDVIIGHEKKGYGEEKREERNHRTKI